MKNFLKTTFIIICATLLVSCTEKTEAPANENTAPSNITNNSNSSDDYPGKPTKAKILIQQNKVHQLTVYSARKEHLIQPIFEAYTRETGIKIEYLTDSAGALVERLKLEKDKTPADILMTVDAGNLWQADQNDLFAPVHSEILEKNIPAHLQSENNTWFGFSKRVRTIVYNTQKVKPSELSTYEDLANSKWKEKLCLRTSNKVYNHSLIATMIHEIGREKTKKVLTGWVNNLAAPVFSSDTEVLKAIASGQCEVGIVNHYYYGRLMLSEPNLPLKLFWPNQNDRGVHTNISGAGLLKASKKKVAATQFLEWLSTEKPQEIFAKLNQEYPVNPSIPVDNMVKSWGDFKVSNTPLEIAGKLQSLAIQLAEEVGYQ